jgi:two-component system, cell cycle response regulator DivK
MKKKIFLIEDNEQNRDLAITLLERRGYEVIPAANGALGIELAVHHQPQLILIDIHLSSMDGHTVAIALGCHPALQTIPIVAMTSHAKADDLDNSRGAGINGHMGKPIDPETFVAEVEHYLQPENRPHRSLGFWSWMARRTTRARVATLPIWGV